IYGETSQGSPFSYTFFSNGGMGARPTKDGLSATGFPSGVRGTPVEIVESSSPLVIHQKELLQDSGGSGKFRGGFGQVISFGTRAHEPLRFTTSFGSDKNPANGLARGNPGAEA